MTPDLLERAGLALFPGVGWRTEMRTALGGIGDRIFRLWLAGRAPIPSGVAADIRALAIERQTELAAIIAELDRTAAK